MFLPLVIVEAADAGTLDSPIEVGAGPSLYWLAGQRPLQAVASIQYGATLRLSRVLSDSAVREHREDADLPAWWYADALAEGEIHLRVTPLDWLIPHDVAFSRSETYANAMYGASWRFYSFGYVLVQQPYKATADVSVAPELSVYHLTMGGTETWFVRPGVAVSLAANFRLSKALRLGVGADGQFHVPQRIGGGVFEFGPLGEALWFIGQPWATLSVRFPSTIHY